MRQRETLAEFRETPSRNAYAKTQLFLGSNRRQCIASFLIEADFNG
jgi:hypothetical protein